MAVLLQYNFSADTAPSTVASNVVGSTILGEQLTTFGTDTPGYGSDPSVTSAPASGATDAASAITADSFLYLSVTPASGYQLDLTSLTFNIARGGAATPRGYDVRSSVDNYAVTLGTAAIPTQRFTYTAVSIDLTDSSFQNLTTTTTFRIYLYAPSTTNNIDMDDITLNGSVSTGGTVEQEGFRWRADDGSETTATWLAGQDVNVIRPVTTPTRLRVILNSTLDRGSENYRLEYRKVGDQTWEVVN